MADPVTLPPVSHTGPDGDNQTWEVPNHTPAEWPETVMGFNLCGRKGAAPDNHNPKADNDISYSAGDLK